MTAIAGLSAISFFPALALVVIGLFALTVYCRKHWNGHIWRLASNIDHEGQETEINVAEKGDMKHSRKYLLENIPFDLEKRAILHKASHFTWSTLRIVSADLGNLLSR